MSENKIRKLVDNESMEEFTKILMRYYNTKKAVDSAKLNGIANSTSATANTIAQRDSVGDINVRLVRSNYANESRMTGAVAFRVSTSDNYIRFCSDPAAVKKWLGIKNSAMEVLWKGNAGYGDTINLNKDLRTYSLIIFDFIGNCGVQFSIPLVYPINPSESNFKVLLSDTWGGTVHNVETATGKITYTGYYNGGAHGDNRIIRILGIKL